MKLFVLCRRGSIVHWAADSVAGWRAAGHDVRIGVTRDSRLSPAIDRLLLSRRLNIPRATLICRAIEKFSPDLILAIAPYGMPLSILQRVAGLPGRAPMIGWVGDLFTADQCQAATLLDAVGYTDSGLLALHHNLQLPSRAGYVPHAASSRLVADRVAQSSRRPRMVFVAHPTGHRIAVVGQIRAPIELYGPGWTRFPEAAHVVQSRRVGIDELANLYCSHLAVLNIRHEEHVLVGLNQRHFDPCLVATPVVTDDQPDLARCFEPGREVLVYHNGDELNDIYARLRRDPTIAAAVGEKARQRVLAEHTYPRRLEALARLCGLEAAA